MTIYTVPLIKRFENWIFKKYFMIGSTVLFFSVLAFALSPKKPDYSIEESLSTMIPIFILGGVGAYILVSLKSGRLNSFMMGLRKPIVEFNEQSFKLFEEEKSIYYCDVLKVKLLVNNHKNNEPNILIIHNAGESFIYGAESTNRIIRLLNKKVFNEDN